MNITKSLLAIIAVAIPCAVFGQKPAPKDYEFTVIKEQPVTSIKNQNRSGTCWCFAGISFLESEAIRINKLKKNEYPDFSEMFVVSNSYKDRADKYIRLDGNLTFGAGSECEDVLHIVRQYGIVPEAEMRGLNYGTDLPVHGELDALALAYVKTIKTNPNKELSTAWKTGFDAVVDSYLGKAPQKFSVMGKEYTPISFRDKMKINPDDYVSLTSFTHHPFYTKFAIEVCDNWRGDLAYNLPLDEFMNAWFYAIENGFTTTWSGDVSEPGFSREGIAVLSEQQKKETSGSDMERWTGKSTDKDSSAVLKEKTVTQESRQEGFDRKKTTDDHGMHVFGIAKDRNGTRYFIVKNSWGESGAYKGIWYISEAYTRAKAIGFIVHKDGLPKEIKNKLGIK